ncbi:MAG: FAD-dependent oxidoreductase [Kofleriaceae bacterium]|nr:FAD-dependent oxidoreductase [Kofleriaceae bacterium]
MDPVLPLPPSIAIIGAGLAGIACGQQLRAAGIPCRIFEKSRGVGGRVATRRFGTQAFDYGTRQLEIRSAAFQDAVAPWAALTTATLEPPTSGLRTIVKQLAVGLDVELATQVTSLGFDRDEVVLTLVDGRQYRFTHVVVTAPLPQALTLLPERTRHAIDPGQLTSLLAVTYQRAVVVSVAVPRSQQVIDEIALAENRLIARLDSRADVQGQVWVARIHNNHIDVAFEKSDAELVAAVTAELSRDGASFAPTESHVQRWRYARVNNPMTATCLAVGPASQLIFAGDAFRADIAPGTTDAAWSSGLAASQIICEQLANAGRVRTGKAT